MVAAAAVETVVVAETAAVVAVEGLQTGAAEAAAGQQTGRLHQRCPRSEKGSLEIHRLPMNSSSCLFDYLLKSD